MAQSFNLFLVNKDWARVGSKTNNYFWKFRLNHDYPGLGGEENPKEQYKLIFTKTGNLYRYDSTDKPYRSENPINDVKNICQALVGPLGHFTFLDIFGNLYIGNFKTYHKIYTNVLRIVDAWPDSVIFMNRQQQILEATSGIINIIWDKFPVRMVKHGSYKSLFILTTTGQLYNYSSLKQTLNQVVTKYDNILDFDIHDNGFSIIYENGLLTYRGRNYPSMY